MSGDIASRLSAVSASVSPLTTLEDATAMLSVSALSRFSAISNEVRVRVRLQETDGQDEVVLQQEATV